MYKDNICKVALLVGAVVCGNATANENFHHGAGTYVPELQLSLSSGSSQSDSAGRFSEEGRFGRMFGLWEKYRGQEPLRPHPSPNYDLRRLGRDNGPMEEKDDVPGDGLAPAGITFLGQFVDHDITLDITSSLDAPAVPEDIRNHRTVSLDLDCVYGLGPEGSPHLYDFPKLVTGDNMGNDRFDLPRFNKRALIGDPRNDENVIVSQIQSAFIAFHNSMVDELHKRLHPEANGNSSEITALTRAEKSELFEKARDHVIHYYHRLIVEDFLPQVIGADRTLDLAHDGRKWYFPTGFYNNDNSSIQHPWMPVEFSVAAYRFGHSQVRSSYHLNRVSQDVPLFSFSEGGESNDMHLMGFSPLNETHLINWRYFFPVSGNEDLMQKARKIDPRLPGHLFTLDKVNVVPAGEPGSLASRNLNRGRVYRLPSGQDIAVAMGVKTPVLADEATVSTLALSETPLWYYILQEASHVHTTWNSSYNMIVEIPPGEDAGAGSETTEGTAAGDGGKGYLAQVTNDDEETIPAPVSEDAGNILGPVGGTIVGEVIYGLIDHYRERTGKGLDYNASIEIGESNTGTYGRRVQMQHMLEFSGQLDFNG